MERFSSRHKCHEKTRTWKASWRKLKSRSACKARSFRHHQTWGKLRCCVKVFMLLLLYWFQRIFIKPSLASSLLLITRMRTREELMDGVVCDNVVMLVSVENALKASESDIKFNSLTYVYTHVYSMLTQNIPSRCIIYFHSRIYDDYDDKQSIERWRRRNLINQMTIKVRASAVSLELWQQRDSPHKFRLYKIKLPRKEFAQSNTANMSWISNIKIESFIAESGKEI